jgi:uncharacterized membrane protein YagU involved in acid resistance
VQRNPRKAIVVGLIGTFVMTMVMLIGPTMGLPPMPIGKMLAGFMGVPQALGWIAHFMIGTILALVYAYVFESRFPGSGVLRGALFGLLPWLISQIVVYPIMGEGLFALDTPAPVLMVFGSLMGHLIYGGVVGGIYRTKSAHIETSANPH